LGACVLYVGVLREQQNRDHATISGLADRVGTLEGSDRVSNEQQSETRDAIEELREGVEIPCAPAAHRPPRPRPVFPSYK